MRFVIVVPGSLVLLFAIAVIGASRGTPAPEKIYPNPQNAEEFLERGELYEKAGSYKEAFSDYQKVVELNPGDSSGYLGQASVLSAMEQPDAAIEKYLFVKEIDQRNGISTRMVEYLIDREREKL